MINSMVLKLSEVNNLRANKFLILFKKAKSLFLICLAVPCVILARLLRPLVLIRFGFLFSSRIGHFAIETELYLCELEKGLRSKKYFDLFYLIHPVCNVQLLKMFARRRELHINDFALWLDRVNRVIPGGLEHVVKSPIERDLHNLLMQTQTHLSFTEQEQGLGIAESKKLGVPENCNFVCFYTRDPAYLNKIMPENNWKYHNYRDSDIKNCLPAIKKLTQKGYFALRMGAVVKEPLDTTDPQIIDYASRARSDFMDIYLSSRCRFFITSAAGLAAVPMAFRVPLVWINFIPLEHVPSWSPNDLFIPKKLWLKNEKRLMTFGEILHSPVSRSLYTHDFEKLGIEILENTAEEISAVVMEMEERLCGNWQASLEDEELQKRFWALFKGSNLHGKIMSRMGRDFLRENQELLG
ncbi:MAG: TIGR04372 family glycosyltransferase [Candidatus Omnitrophica bacterium]|nr:TIGR04372 family glycosyltransferase [Candidatus Omnitrophota bacterium]